MRLSVIRSFKLTQSRQLLPKNAWKARKAPISSTTLKATAETTDLEWETFEFSQSPKFDRRFDDNSHRHAVDDDAEALRDEALRQRMQAQHDAWKRLDPTTIQAATQALAEYITEERYQRIQSVLDQRTQSVRFLFENPSNPSNVWACLRTLDAFGIQHADVVLQSQRYEGKAAISQKRGVRTAMGAAQWLTVHNHASTAHAVQALSHCRLLAADLNAQAVDVRNVDWKQNDDDRPICIVMGNEERGISDEMRALVDGSFVLPMAGFAESFNLSVATAVTCAHLQAANALQAGNLPPDERDYLLLRGVYRSVANRKVADGILQRNKIVLPGGVL